MRLPGFHSEIKPKRRRQIYEDVTELSRPTGSYYVMMALSTVIAAYGLLIDSAPVVAGAMLVAPLMGPIFGIALALVSNNRRLLWSSLQSELTGIFIALAVGVLIGLAPLRVPFGSEWLVRTQPTLYDLAIALASGLAGAYALIDERVSPALPGVAISVAVLPPLATCGLAVSAGEWEMAGGAAMLFTANFFAIQIAGAAIFSIFGMLRVKRNRRDRIENDEGVKILQFLKRFSLTIIILVVIGIFMTQTLIGLATDHRLEAAIDDTLSAAVGGISGARISDTSFSREDEHLRVTAQVLTPRVFTTGEIAAIEDELKEAVDQDVHLVVRSLISRDMDREGMVFATPEDERLSVERRERREFIQHASRIISRHLREVPGAELSDVDRSRSDGMTTVTAIVRAPEPIGPETVAAIEEGLQSEFDRSLRFTVRTVLTQAASSDDFLYDEATRRALTEREALASAVQTVTDSWLSEEVDGAVVEEVRIEALDPRVIAVTILTPRPLADDEPAQMRAALSNVIGPEFDLTVRYALGGLAVPGEPEDGEVEPPSDVAED
ncbi:MAG: DUF389 domain-containing protein [Armatimonadota bacterium]